jgi:hypothetical protein
MNPILSAFLAQAGIDSARSALNTAISSLPKYVIGARIKVYGDRNADQNDLMKLALSVAQNRCGGIALWGSAMQDTKVSYSLDENSVEVDVSYSWGEDTIIAVQAGSVATDGLINRPPVASGVDALFGILESPYPVMGVDEFGNPAEAMTQEDAPNPAFNSAGTRGTWLEELVTAALSNPNEVLESVP